VVGVDTVTDSAQVVDLQPDRNRPVDLFVVPTVSEQILPADTHHAVPRLGRGLQLPDPTLRLEAPVFREIADLLVGL
jgi:hypothetical protein